MGSITLNRDESMRILQKSDSSPDARVIAACSLALIETNDHVDDIESSTRSITLKLAHMVASVIYDNSES